MKRDRSWVLIVATLGMLLMVGIPTAAANSARRPSNDGQFFSGQGPELLGPFPLLGGLYSIDVHAYDPLEYVNNNEDCIFGAYIDGIQTPLHKNLSLPIPIASFPPYHYTPIVIFPAGHYKLFVLPGTDCDWSVSILRLGAAPPGIDIVSLGIFLHQGHTFTPTTVVHMGQTIDFSAFYLLFGTVSGTPAGQVAFAENGKTIASSHLRGWPDDHGIKQLYNNLIFTPGGGVVPGPVVATFTVTDGKMRASQSVDFTLAR